MRGLILGVAERPFIRGLATGGAGRRVALRFVAGETIDDGMSVARRLQSDGFSVSLDYLGENVTSLAEAQDATKVYLELIERLASDSVNGNVSVKLTQLGLDVDEDAAMANALALTELAAAKQSSVTLDMEDHRYTDRTIEACLKLDAQYPGRAGVAVQTYLYRTPEDVNRLLHVPVRLCKGAYKEPELVAHPKKQDVDAAYARLIVRLLQDGRYPMIATHDERLIRFTKRQATRLDRTPHSFEFQMLYGIRRDLQRQLVDEGYRVRVYVPFGRQWYPYFMRRLAERPANVLFFLSQLARR